MRVNHEITYSQKMRLLGLYLHSLVGPNSNVEPDKKSFLLYSQSRLIESGMSVFEPKIPTFIVHNEDRIAHYNRMWFKKKPYDGL